MPFFTFSQNNPGGRFWLDHDRGIGTYVVMEAADAEQAMSKMETLGVVFYGDECPGCCGSRWYSPMDESAEPILYGEPITDYPVDPARPEHSYCGYVHHADGRVIPFGGEVEP